MGWVMALDPRHLAAEMGHSEICQLILATVEEKNPKDSDGWTPRGHFTWLLKRVIYKYAK